ncbi:hypothetical protein NECID01_0464 [Nematocida sp. AWRm77]|nr:hypothetical protein NECID01_0464 [Nematocida sp. AWRm77]
MSRPSYLSTPQSWNRETVEAHRRREKKYNHAVSLLFHVLACMYTALSGYFVYRFVSVIYNYTDLYSIKSGIISGWVLLFTSVLCFLVYNFHFKVGVLYKNIHKCYSSLEYNRLSLHPFSFNYTSFMITSIANQLPNIWQYVLPILPIIIIKGSMLWSYKWNAVLDAFMHALIMVFAFFYIWHSKMNGVEHFIIFRVAKPVVQWMNRNRNIENLMCARWFCGYVYVFLGHVLLWASESVFDSVLVYAHIVWTLLLFYVANLYLGFSQAEFLISSSVPYTIRGNIAYLCRNPKKIYPRLCGVSLIFGMLLSVHTLRKVLPRRTAPALRAFRDKVYRERYDQIEIECLYYILEGNYYRQLKYTLDIPNTCYWVATKALSVGKTVLYSVLVSSLMCSTFLLVGSKLFMSCASINNEFTPSPDYYHYPPYARRVTYSPCGRSVTYSSYFHRATSNSTSNPTATFTLEFTPMPTSKSTPKSTPKSTSKSTSTSKPPNKHDPVLTWGSDSSTIPRNTKRGPDLFSFMFLGVGGLIITDIDVENFSVYPIAVFLLKFAFSAWALFMVNASVCALLFMSFRSVMILRDNFVGEDLKLSKDLFNHLMEELLSAFDGQTTDKLQLATSPNLPDRSDLLHDSQFLMMLYNL